MNGLGLKNLKKRVFFYFYFYFEGDGNVVTEEEARFNWKM